jgi:uncharacterized protein (TIGR02145 family)
MSSSSEEAGSGSSEEKSSSSEEEGSSSSEEKMSSSSEEADSSSSEEEMSSSSEETDSSSSKEEGSSSSEEEMSSSSEETDSSSSEEKSSSSEKEVSSSSSSLPLCGTTSYDPETHFCYSNQAYSCGNKPYNPTTQFCDTRDNEIYKWVKIGTQTWMAENLNFNANGSRCYGDNSGGDSQSRCVTYGRLYSWNTATENSTLSRVCPDGWHLPNNGQWDGLVAYVHSDNGLASYTSGFSSSVASPYLKAASYWTSSGNGNGNDKYGFSALPGGGLHSGNFSGVGSSGYWWSSTTQYDSSRGSCRIMHHNNSSVDWSACYKTNLLSVRCVKN